MKRSNYVSALFFICIQWFCAFPACSTPAQSQLNNLAAGPLNTEANTWLNQFGTANIELTGDTFTVS